MLKPTITMGVILITALAFGVYQVENRVQQLRGELASLDAELQKDREALHVLQAEWSFVTQPERLKAMVDKHLELSYVQTDQVKTIDSIPLRTSEVASIRY